MTIKVSEETMKVKTLFGLLALLAVLPGQAAESARDPYDSGVWSSLQKEYLGDGKVVFDDRVKVVGPKFADDPMNVPISVNASALDDVREVVVMVDRNPIRKILSFEPYKARPTLSFRFKLQEASPVRAAARTGDGVWHVGSTWVDSSGGGCTLPGGTRAAGTWPQTLNQVYGRSFSHRGEAERVRLRIMHPMDTGLVTGIPAFYIDELKLADEAGTVFMHIYTFEPVSENPVFTFDLGVKPQGRLILTGRDNNGNLVKGAIE